MFVDVTLQRSGPSTNTGSSHRIAIDSRRLAYMEPNLGWIFETENIEFPSSSPWDQIKHPVLYPSCALQPPALIETNGVVQVKDNDLFIPIFTPRP